MEMPEGEVNENKEKSIKTPEKKTKLQSDKDKSCKKDFEKSESMFIGCGNSKDLGRLIRTRKNFKSF